MRDVTRRRRKSSRCAAAVVARKGAKPAPARRAARAAEACRGEAEEKAAPADASGAAHLVVVDFECTCEDQEEPLHEIIEFPAF